MAGLALDGPVEKMMGMKSTRDNLIETGLQLMHRNGYYATGIKEILDTAQVPKGTFYHYGTARLPEVR
ncbi:TetR family transcriptional regulator [Edaphobacter modestus]|uniref:TetR family transcriptional regulator n=2 Tax=Edaphobacter modestus TaxID=388466 RepID=A0A4Q7Y1V0_9BACT|nr:TetR family transcriptional regulator [Edaphobacter modestus]